MPKRQVHLLPLCMQIKWLQSPNNDEYHTATFGAFKLIVFQDKNGNGATYRITVDGVVREDGRSGSVAFAKAEAERLARELGA